MQQVYCPQCGALVEAENINLNNMMAKCGQCNAVFSIADRQPSGAWSSSSSPRDQDPIPMAMPNNISVDNDGRRLQIIRRWRSWQVLFLLPFTLFWNGIIFVVFVPNFSRNSFDNMPTLFLLPFMLIGLGFAYYSLAMLLNSTTITVDRDQMLIRHGPLPFPGKTSQPGGPPAALYQAARLHQFRQRHLDQL